MAFFKKFKNNIGLEEETKKKQDEYEEEKGLNDDGDNHEDEDENEDAERAEKKSAKEKSRKKAEKKDKDANDETKVPVAEKSAFDWLKTKGQLAVDVFQTEGEFCVQAPIAGVEQNDIDIAVENEMLIIRGERRGPILGKERKYFYQECYWGPFSRQIILPEDINSEKIKASLKNGILVIRIPKAEPKRKKIIVDIE